MEDKDYGYIKIKLSELIKDRKISKNKLAHRAEMQRSQINHYCSGEITRLDTAVLSRLCTTLNCKIEDLLEFVPKEETTDNPIQSFYSSLVCKKSNQITNNLYSYTIFSTLYLYKYQQQEREDFLWKNMIMCI